MQTAYKRTKGVFADNFENLIEFLEFDSIPIIKAIGETPDSLTDSQALQLGIISRDTAYVLAKNGELKLHVVRKWLKNWRFPFPGQELLKEKKIEMLILKL